MQLVKTGKDRKPIGRVVVRACLYVGARTGYVCVRRWMWTSNQPGGQMDIKHGGPKSARKDVGS